MPIRRTDAQILAQLVERLLRDPKIQARRARVQFLPGTRVLEITGAGLPPWNVLVDAGRLRDDFEGAAQQILDTWTVLDRG